ncbi:DUF4340 domain-containing protein [Alteromonas sp. C1M14]|uniref:DUF4340 domain-containing protein n=1 Tax=Alteromonas sp. C1M14 TaxID=2841567 RepID=UPI001C0A6459|nr:DUF4340 domain-containing protein [Alteromonas sp. C1M14]MBU2979123.1 DUF4340 domain-containing protein [Alteromonas sp. C1M14]
MSLRILILALLTFGAGSFVWWVELQTQREDEQHSAEQSLAVDIARAAKDIQRIKIENHNGVLFSAVKEKDQWLATHLDTIMTFPSDTGKLAQFAGALTNIAVVESKTANAENYTRLGVESVRSEDAQSVLVEIGGPREVFSLLVGRMAKGQRGTYVRQPEEQTSMLVSERIPLPATQGDWLSRDVMPFKEKMLLSVVKEVTGTSPLDFERKEDGEWTIPSVDEGALYHPLAVSEAVNGLMHIDYEAVKPFLQHEWNEVTIAQQWLFTLEDESKVWLYVSTPDENGHYQLWINTPDSPHWVSEWVFVLSEYQVQPFEVSLSTLLQS